MSGEVLLHARGDTAALQHDVVTIAAQEAWPCSCSWTGAASSKQQCRHRHRQPPGQMIAIFLKMNKIPTDGSTFSRFIWDESRSWVAGGGQGWTLPGSGVLLRHGDTITDRRARQPGLACRVQTVQANFISLTYSFQGNESPKP